MATALCQEMHNTILVDKVVRDVEERQKILRTLEEHIKTNIVKVAYSCLA